MDPLSALSVAAAVIQFVDFSQRLFVETWSIYRSASGESMVLEDLSTVSRDLEQLSTSVERALEHTQGRENGPSVSQYADKSLLRACAECRAISSDIQNILLEIGHRFQPMAVANKELAKKEFNGSLSLGECFRKALMQYWKRDKIDKLNERLADVRLQIIQAAMMSIWSSSKNTKTWEESVSDKLDRLVSMGNRAMNEKRGLGPGVGIETLDLDSEDEGQTLANYPWDQKGEIVIERDTRVCIRMTRIADQILGRLWSKDWEPSAVLLSSFPKRTSVSAAEVKAEIIKALRYETMDNRAEAINDTFRSTYEWVFNQVPRRSETGEEMWSSLPKWIKGNTGVPFWITGKPGSGKSTMMKYIINHQDTNRLLTEWAQPYSLQTVHYYAWKPGSDLDKSEGGLIRTLLHQVLQKDPDLVPFVCPRRWTLFHTVRELSMFPDWGLEELYESFAHVLERAKNSMRFAIFIDGLDEFDVAPLKICSTIQGMARHHTVKICVASRSWPEFNDAFSLCPMMEMHLLTMDDMRTFVLHQFEDMPAFKEFNTVYRNDGYQLLLETVSKAQGVFLWISLVTQTMLQALIEGSSLSQLRAILNTMPVEIEELYDAIYATIPKTLLPEVSIMLRIYHSACGPVDWLTLWLADESRGTKLEFEHIIDIEQVYLLLKRRLGARTRGILGLVRATKNVEYLHRTASEWIGQPRVLERLRRESPSYFDPCWSLLRAETLQMEHCSVKERIVENDDFWKRVMRSLMYASLVDGAIIPDKRVHDVINDFRRAAREAAFILCHQSPRASDDIWIRSRVGRNAPSVIFSEDFAELAAQFAVLPFIYEEHRRKSHHLELNYNNREFGLLEQVVFGFARYFRLDTVDGVDPARIPPSRRLELLSFLVGEGLREPGLLEIIEAEEFSPTFGDGWLTHEYLAEVRRVLAEHGPTAKRMNVFQKYKNEWKRAREARKMRRAQK